MMLLWFLAGCATTAPSKVGPMRSEATVQAILDGAVQEFSLPGGQVAIRFGDGRTILASSGPGISNDSLFRVGSTTKMFVAALVFRLVDEGRMSIDDPIDRWFPELPFASLTTVKELLGHTSGLPENLFTDPLVLIPSLLFPKTRWEPRAMAPRLLKGVQVPQDRRGRFLYSNDNYLLLGLIAETVRGRPLADQFQDEFFTPLGMKDTYLLPFYDKLPPELGSGVDWYLPFGPHTVTPDTTSWDTLMFSAGALACTARDLSVWTEALFHGRILSAESQARMRTYTDARNNGRDEAIVGYGLGLASYRIGEWTMEGHPGAAMGGECFPFYVPRLDAVVVVSYNLSRKDNPAGKAILARILGLLEPGSSN